MQERMESFRACKKCLIFLTTEKINAKNERSVGNATSCQDEFGDEKVLTPYNATRERFRRFHLT